MMPSHQGDLIKVTHCPRINMRYYPLIKRSQHPSLTTTRGPRESDSATAWAVVASRSTALRTPLLMPLCPLYTCLTPLTRTHTSKHASGMETLLQCDVETLFQCHIDIETLLQSCSALPSRPRAFPSRPRAKPNRAHSDNKGG